MLRTWAFFTFGGFFTACYSNIVRFYPMMRRPSFILTSTVTGGILGYLAHRYEENSEERVKLLLEKHRHAPVEWAKMTTNDVPEEE